MKTYEIQTTDGSKFIKTEASTEQIQEAINFITHKEGATVEKLLQGLRLLGYKSTEIKLDAVDVFEL